MRSLQQEKTRQDRLEASIVVLPLVLYELSELCETRMNAIFFGEVTKPDTACQWEMSDFHLNVIRDCVQFADGRERSGLQQLVRIYQVLIARWPEMSVVDLPKVNSEWWERTGARSQLYALENWVSLRALVHGLYGFARRGADLDAYEKIKDEVYFSMRHLTDGGFGATFGWSMMGIPEYAKFVDGMYERSRVGLLGEDWSPEW